MDEDDLYDDYDLDEDEDDRWKYVRMLVVLLRPRLVESSVIVCNYLRCAMR